MDCGARASLAPGFEFLAKIVAADSPLARAKYQIN